MVFKATLWTCAAGGIAYGDYNDGLLITPIFTSQDSFEIFDKKIKTHPYLPDTTLKQLL